MIKNTYNNEDLEISVTCSKEIKNITIIILIAFHILLLSFILGISTFYVKWYAHDTDNLFIAVLAIGTGQVAFVIVSLSFYISCVFLFCLMIECLCKCQRIQEGEIVAKI